MSIINCDTHPSTTYQGHYGWHLNLQGVYYGPGCTKTVLPQLLDDLGIKRVMLLTSKSVLNKTDSAKKVEDILQERNALGTTFHQIEQHSPIAGIRAAINAFESSGCDGIVSVGGGSCIDAAKTLLYFYQQDKGGRAPYQIAIPTTLSAAEYQIGAGYTNDQGIKVAVNSHEIIPAGIILDAELTLATPERLWLSTGIKSLDHAVENLTRDQVTPPVKVLGYQAISDLFRYLPLSKDKPDSVEIRQKLQLASWMSLWPMKLKYSALGISHSVGHKIGSRYSIPHGITSCLTLPSVIALQAQVGTQENKEFVAAALKHIGEPSTGTVDGDILKFSNHVKQLIQELGLSSKLSDYNVPRSDLREVAIQSLGQVDHPWLESVVSMLEDMY